MPWRQHNPTSRQKGMRPIQSQQHVPVSAAAICLDDEPSTLHTLDTPAPYLPNSPTGYHPHSTHASPQLLSVLTDMQATRKAFRSLRSFTHAARHNVTASEIVSDPIVNDDLASSPEIPKLNRSHRSSSSDDIVVESPTPVKRPGVTRASRVTSSLETDANFNNHADSSNEVHSLPFNLVPENSTNKSSLKLNVSSQGPANELTDAQSSGHPKLPQTHSQKSQSASRQPALPRQTRSQTRQGQSRPDRATANEPALRPLNMNFNLPSISASSPTRSKDHRVFDLEQLAERTETPPVKRRRTRSYTQRKRESSPSPEVDELLLRQLVDNATDEERKAILAASTSSRGRRKLRKLFVHDDEDGVQRTKTSGSISLKDGDVEWLGTSYDSVEEVATTPSPPTKRRKHSNPSKKASRGDRGRQRTRQTVVERIDTSESPERVMRRRSRKLNRDINQASRRGNLNGGVETIESSSSPGPKTGRSRRVTRANELPSKEAANSDHSDHSESSGESLIEKDVRSKRTRRRNGISRSRPLPKPKAGVLRERLRRRTPLLPMKKKPSKKFIRKSSSRDGHSSDRDSSAPRRSKRLRNSRSRSRPLVDVDADDEVIEEGSADENEGNGTSYELEEQEVSSDEEEAEVEEEEEDGDIQLDDREEDEEDDYDEEDDNFEEREWKEQLKRKQIRRKRKRNGRRKRTQPRDVFGTEGEFLTAREQKQRLDFLVKQSADIAGHLHKVMRLASQRSSITTSGVKSKSTESVGSSGEEVKKEESNGIDSSSNRNPDIGNEHAEGECEATKKEETFVPPSGSGCELQPHQQEGVDWLLTLDAQGLNAILADEMGLGKTIQAISFLASLVISGSRGPHLIVAPKNVCQHWADEVRKWYPTELTVAIHLGNSDDRLEKLKPVLEDDNFDIIITSYEHAVRDLFTRKRRDGISWEHMQVLRAFRRVEFEYLVIDEAHRLKSDASKTNIAIRNYSLAQRRLLLTGTPLSNNLQELWCLMNVLNPRIFSSKATFEAWFAAPFASKTTKRSKVSLTHAEQSVVVDRLHTVIRPFFRRRVRADVCPSFTSADEVVIRCPLSALQRAVLLHLQRRATANEAGISNVIMAMRSASNHPYIVSDALFDPDHACASERLVASSGKFVFLHFALPRLINSGHRVLIFSQFKLVLDLVEDLLAKLGLKFRRLDGETSSDDRLTGLAEFNREGSDIPVFLLTTRAGGIGLNLQTADTVILFDSDWNPSADLQAVSRIQRIGQKRTVHILRLVTEKSVDDIIVETARHKLRTQNVAVGAGKFNTSMGAALDSRMRQKDLEDLLKRLEAQNYAGDQEEVTQCASKENGSPESSPKRVNLRTQNRRFEEWGKQLLRKGESSLSSVDIAPIWIDNRTDLSDSCIPHWLAKDADLQSASKALRCTDVSSACRVYEENLLMKTEAGKLNRKDRAIRAKRQIAVIDISDADSQEETERSDDPSVDYAGFSDHESDHEVPAEETATENIPKKSNKTGLLQGWTRKAVHKASLDPKDSVPSASGSIDSIIQYRMLQALRPPHNNGLTKAQALTSGKSDERGITHICGTNNASVNSMGNWGPPLNIVNPSLTQRQPGFTPQQGLLPIAHRKHLSPAKRVPSSSHLTTWTASHMHQTAVAPGSRHSQHAGSSTTTDGPGTSIFDHHATATALPAWSQSSPQVTMPTWSCLPSSTVPQKEKAVTFQSKSRSGSTANFTGPAQTKMSSGSKTTTARLVIDPNRRQMSASKKTEPRPANVMKSEEVELMSSDFSEEFFFVDSAIATGETESIRPVASKRPRIEVGHSRNVVTLKDDIQQSDKTKTEAEQVLKLAKNGLPDDSIPAAVPPANPIGAEQFTRQVERLREMTKVLDTEFLEDVLLDCDCDIETARNKVLRQLNYF